MGIGTKLFKNILFGCWESVGKKHNHTCELGFFSIWDLRELNFCCNYPAIRYSKLSSLSMSIPRTIRNVFWRLVLRSLTTAYMLSNLSHDVQRLCHAIICGEIYAIWCSSTICNAMLVHHEMFCNILPENGCVTIFRFTKQVVCPVGFEQ